MRNRLRNAFNRPVGMCYQAVVGQAIGAALRVDKGLNDAPDAKKKNDSFICKRRFAVAALVCLLSWQLDGRDSFHIAIHPCLTMRR